MTDHADGDGALFDVLAAEFLELPGVASARMFSHTGLTTCGAFFAFPSGQGELIVKLPADRVVQLIATGQANAMRLGRRTMREWAVITGDPTPGRIPDHHQHWRGLMVEAHAYVTELSSRRPRR
ncbi:MAG: hypothetical protein JOZ47_01500 [Kutzneria sp.]|nr:hypothetical protein [Kutzneria sp.]